MMERSHHSPVWLALLLCPCSLQAQERHVRAGDKAFEQLHFPEAVEHYRDAARAGAPDSLFASRLAHSYLFMRDEANARQWFARSVACAEPPVQDLFDYAAVLRAAGSLPEADQWLARFAERVPGDSRPKRLMNSAGYMDRLRKGMGRRCEVRCLSINSADADLGAAFHGNDVVFASARTGQGSSDTWNGQPFLDLYAAHAGAGGELTDPVPLGALNTRYHESNATFSADGTRVWFDRNDFHGKRKGFDANGAMAMKIYSRRLVNGEWTDEQPFPFNTNGGSVCHPSLACHDSVLFFSSDRPGGHGGSDIWYTRLGAQGKWGDPVCLGGEVNTEGDEMFPFLSAQGDLYFASDGHAGLGGLDILHCPFADGRVTGVAVNNGAPLNSDHDDFALVLAPDGRHGYFTSDRPGGKGSDDLYAVTFRGPLVGAEGVARDRLGGQLLPGTRVVLTDDKGVALDSTVTDEQGAYTLSMRRGRAQELVFSLPGYRTLQFPLETPADEDTTYTLDPPMAFLRDVGLWMFVSDSFTGEGIDGVNIMVTDVGGGNVSLVNDHTNVQGDYRRMLNDVSIHDSLVYRVKLDRAGYYPKKGLFLYVIPDSGEIAMHHAMDISMEPIRVGSDAAKAMELKPILFATNKWDLSEAAKAELDKVVELMSDNPNVIMELRGHTDSRGADHDNLVLSDRRAKTSAAYMVAEGIARERIKGRGYGETQLLNDCGNGSKCTEAEHQVNRRTEFIITRM